MQPVLNPAPTWLNRFAALGTDFYTRWQPTPLPDPTWVVCSDRLAEQLGWSHDWASQPAMIEILSGNQSWPGSAPLASVYSGHQFGVWAGQLGDGRALWLGEFDTPMGPQEIQLKGSGPTPYSRHADGRAVLRSCIREFLCSEAMHGLGIPSTRALALVASPQPVWRETQETAAVVTRVAPSFIRFGHFEHFAARGQLHALQKLLDFCRHTLGLGTKEGTTPALALLADVTHRTACLMAQWQAVGFCHGVMNTDNMSILGLTLDYGPFQFIDGYDPEHICNHSDTHGRYAFDQQPQVAHWNLYALGQALLTLEPDQDAILAVLQSYASSYEQAWLVQMRRKMGCQEPHSDDLAQLKELYEWMASEQCDHTIFWWRLSQAVANWQAGLAFDSAMKPVIDLAPGPRLTLWLNGLRRRLESEGRTDAGQRMLRSNPRFVLRNHLAEQVIQAAQKGDAKPVRQLLEVLQNPYDSHPAHVAWADFPPEWARHIQISCSS